MVPYLVFSSPNYFSGQTQLGSMVLQSPKENQLMEIFCSNERIVLLWEKHTQSKSKHTKIAKPILKFIYDAKMLGKIVETLKEIFYRCPFL